MKNGLGILLESLALSCTEPLQFSQFVTVFTTNGRSLVVRLTPSFTSSKLHACGATQCAEVSGPGTKQASSGATNLGRQMRGLSHAQQQSRYHQKLMT